MNGEVGPGPSGLTNIIYIVTQLPYFHWEWPLETTQSILCSCFINREPIILVVFVHYYLNSKGLLVALKCTADNHSSHPCFADFS